MKNIKKVKHSQKKELNTVKKRSNMHEGIADWCDCCSCEPEERWVEVAEKMGIDLNDYQE